MENYSFQIERSKIEYHRSRSEQYPRYLQIKKGKRNISIYLSTLIPYSSSVKFYLDCETKEITRKKERGRQTLYTIDYIYPLH